MALPNGDLITTVFDPQMAYPVDKRMQVDTLNSRDSISMFIRWEGMTVYVLEDSKIYILQGGRSNEFWKELGTGSGTGGTTFVGQFATADLLPTTGRSAGDYAFVGTGDDFVQYNWDNIANQWVMAEGQTDMASEFFHIGYKTPLRRPVIFPLFHKDVLVQDSGDFVFAPETSVARFIFTGEVTAIRGIETAAADREIKLVNRTGSDIPLRDKAPGIPTGSGMDFGGTDYTWVNGSEITLKGNGTYWELAPNNQVAFSDHLDSVNAQVSIGSDGMDVWSGIENTYTGESYNYKEYSSTPSIIDGSIFVQVNGKYLKRVFTTPIDLESVGIVYNSTSHSVTNYNIIIGLINLGQPICVKSKTFITASNLPVTSSKILIYGDNEDSEIISTAAGIFMNIPNTIDSLVIKDIKITSQSGLLRFVDKNGVDFTANNILLQNIKGFGNLRFYLIGDDNLNSKIDYMGVKDCTFINNNNSFIQVTNIGYELIEILNNKIYDFIYNFFYNGILGIVPGMKNSMKLLRVNGNTVRNSDNVFLNSGSGLYYCFILTECYESHYTNNYVYGLKSVVPIAVYDIYQSSIISRYTGNTLENSLCFTAMDDLGTKTLYKGKGGLHKTVEGNRFVIKKSFIDDFLANNESLGLSLDNCHVSYAAFDTSENGRMEVFYKNNYVDVYYLDNGGVSGAVHKTFIVDGNEFIFDRLGLPFTNYSLRYAIGSNRRYSFSDNIVTKTGTGETYGHLISTNTSQAIPEEQRDYLEFSINNNIINNYNGILIYNVIANKLNYSDNTMTCLNSANPETPCILSGGGIKDLYSKNNRITSDIAVHDLTNTNNIHKAVIDCEYNLIGTKIIAPTGLTIIPRQFNYTVVSVISINTTEYGDIEVSIPILQEFDGTDSYLNYIDYANGTSYRVKIMTGMTLGNGSTSNHIIFTLQSPRTGSTIGTIRIYASNGNPRVSIVLTNDNNYKIRRIDHVQN